MVVNKSTLVHKSGSVLVLVTAISILGCIEEKSEYTVNPDGSGKVTYDLTFVPRSMDRSDPEGTPQDQIKPEVEQILRHSKGVETWKDISFELTDEGAVNFTGTAYFPDINELSLRRPGFPNLYKLELSAKRSGRIIIELRSYPDPKKKIEKRSATKYSEAELAQKVKLAKLRYNQARPMVMAIFGTFKLDSVLHLPAKIEKISNFEKVNDTTVRWKLESSKMIEAMDKMMDDEKRLKEKIQAGEDPLPDGPDELIANEMLFTQKGPIQVVLSSGSGNLFDYDTEVSAAQRNYDKMLKQLGLVLTRAEPVGAPTVSSVSAEPGTVRVGGVRLVRHYNEERGIRPLSWSKGYTLSLILELSEPNLVITHGRVEKAVTDTGKSILRPHTGISSPKLSKDGKAVVFDIKLSVPDEDVKGLAELSGALVYLKSVGTKKIDLGVMDFKEDARSNIEGFSIRSIRPDWSKGHTRIELGVDLLLGTIKSVEFYGEDGTELEVSQSGKSFSRDRLLDIGYKTKGKFPPRGRIVIEVLDEVTKHEIHFKLTNISLTGEPL